MRTALFMVMAFGSSALPASADTVRSNQKDYGSQSNTVTSHAHGAPAKVVRDLSPDEIARNRRAAAIYIQRAAAFRVGLELPATYQPMTNSPA